MRRLAMVLLLLGLATPARGELRVRTFLPETGPPASRAQGTLLIDFDVLESNGDVVAGLAPQEIELVLEDGKTIRPKEVVRALDRMNEIGGLSLLGLVQSTPATAKLLPLLQPALLDWIRATQAQARAIYVAVYSDHTKVRFEYIGGATTHPIPSIDLTMEDATDPASGVDALLTVKGYPMQGRRRLLILFTDGRDTETDERQFVSVGQVLAEQRLIVDVVVCANSAATKPGSVPTSSAPIERWRRLAKATHGTLRTCKSAADLKEVLGQVTKEIKEQHRAVFPWDTSESHQVRLRVRRAKTVETSAPLQIDSGFYGPVPGRKN